MGKLKDKIPIDQHNAHIVQCPYRAEPNGQENSCHARMSSCFFDHLASEAIQKMPRHFLDLPGRRHREGEAGRKPAKREAKNGRNLTCRRDFCK